MPTAQFIELNDQCQLFKYFLYFYLHFIQILINKYYLIKKDNKFIFIKSSKIYQHKIT